jgi:tRNA1(Val) A37 N6-methylase TrmN6
MEFLESSLAIQKMLGRKTRARRGIFFTPKTLRDIVISKIDIYPKRILDPTCGSGEFLVDCAKTWSDAESTGVELTDDIVPIARANASTATVDHADFMTWTAEEKFDLIIGNPPFVKLTKSPNKHMYTTSSNLYIEVPFKCLTEHLATDGILAMVLPSTIQNGTWCSKLRDLFFSLDIAHFEIIRDHEFKDTQAGVALIVVRNRPGNNDRYNFNGVLTEHADDLRRMTHGQKKFSDYDLNLVGGAGSARDYKKRYGSEDADVAFILTGEFKQDRVEFGNKRLFVKTDKYHSGRCLILSRTKGVTMGDRYDLKYAMFDHPKFLFESCMYAIFGDDIDVLHESLQDTRTAKYLQTIAGSGRLTIPTIKNMPIFPSRSLDIP